ncbi:uncharacterized protein BX664DRAFT_153813 [Halteromyces radiatus]|uniref:uncharacterized protein n=1 Tax=Halteromyces radiatus TaxID=101107 RepID=UPI00221F6870|nr:uncharacterized protein BX664DRAFT_153813 [Halteromyces radiatus]KAI8086256.1 hypothetical protein BX664DRAFT_153813 [Halteromyces radiatus]
MHSQDLVLQPLHFWNLSFPLSHTHMIIETRSLFQAVDHSLPLPILCLLLSVIPRFHVSSYMLLMLFLIITSLLPFPALLDKPLMVSSSHSLDTKKRKRDNNIHHIMIIIQSGSLVCLLVGSLLASCIEEQLFISLRVLICAKDLMNLSCTYLITPSPSPLIISHRFLLFLLFLIITTIKKKVFHIMSNFIVSSVKHQEKKKGGEYPYFGKWIATWLKVANRKRTKE